VGTGVGIGIGGMGCMGLVPPLPCATPRVLCRQARRQRWGMRMAEDQPLTLLVMALGVTEEECGRLGPELPGQAPVGPPGNPSHMGRETVSGVEGGGGGGCCPEVWMLALGTLASAHLHRPMGFPRPGASFGG
jgi:hypothetical protein